MNWTLSNKFWLNLSHTTNIFWIKNTFENVVCKMVAIFLGPGELSVAPYLCRSGVWIAALHSPAAAAGWSDKSDRTDNYEKSPSVWLGTPVATARGVHRGKDPGGCRMHAQATSWCMHSTTPRILWNRVRDDRECGHYDIVFFTFSNTFARQKILFLFISTTHLTIWEFVDHRWVPLTECQECGKRFQCISWRHHGIYANDLRASTNVDMTT